jgi:DeoR family transcriptional regulator, aga operon transcriptional repressor
VVRRPERLSALLDLVGRRGSISVEDVTDEFGVSAATARRDLDDLAAQQLVSRTRGGAVAHAVNYDLPLRYKSGRNPDEKRRIADAAAELVEAGSVVGLNGGTTNTEVARSIAVRAVAGSLTGLTVVTNALNIANELAVRPQLKIVVVGGVVRPQSFELIGAFTEAVLTGLALDVMFLGVDALSAADGAGADHEGEAHINRLMVERAARTVAVLDSSKLGRRAFCRICPVADLERVITDTGADRKDVAALHDQGVQVQTV